MKFLQMIVIGLLISLSASYLSVTFSMLPDPETAITGPELFTQVKIAAVLGGVIGLLSTIFMTERLPFTVQLILHYICVNISVLIAGYFGDWYNSFSLTRLFLIVLFIYIVVWVILFILQMLDITKINKELQRRKHS